MKGALIGAESRTLVDRDYDEIPPNELPLWERAKALKVLGRECDSWTRLGVGLVIWLGLVAGSAGISASISHDAPIWFRVATFAAGVVVLGVCLRWARRVWQAGRQVIDAFCWWTLMPERLPDGGTGVHGWRSDPVLDATAARLFVFDGTRVVRIVLASLSAFVPIAFFDSLDSGPRFSWYDGQTVALTLFSVLLGVVGFGTAIVLLWGQYRAARAHAERDPIQRWILRRDR